MSVHLLYIHRMIGPLTQCRLRSYNCFSTHAWRTQGAREATFATSAQGCYGAQRLALSDDTCRNLHVLIDGRAPFKNRREHSAMVRRRGQGCGGRSFQLTRLGSSRNSLGENEGDSSEEDPLCTACKPLGPKGLQNCASFASSGLPPLGHKRHAFCSPQCVFAHIFFRPWW